MTLTICSALLVGGCGSTSSSATVTENDEVQGEQGEQEEREEQKQEQEEQNFDPKLVHRFEQRGFDVNDMVISEGTVDESEKEEDPQEEEEPTAAEKMADEGGYTPVELVIQEGVNFNNQTIQYFEEDIYMNYPPPKKDEIDVIATVIYERDSDFILDGLIRNGYADATFTKSQLEPLILKLISDTNQEWIVTKLTDLQEVTEVKGGEAVPFRLLIPKDKVRISHFDYSQFGYHALIQQPTVEK